MSRKFLRKTGNFVFWSICLLLSVGNSICQTPSESPRLTVNAGHVGFPHDLKFSLDGKFFATVSGAEAILWETETGRELRRFNLGTARDSGKISFSPKGELLAAEAKGGTRIWDTRSGKLLRTLEKVYQPIFSGSGNFLVGLRSDSIKLFNTANFDVSATLAPADDSRILDLALSADEKLLATINEGAVKIWNLERRAEENFSIKHQTGSIRAIDFSPSGKMLSTVGDDETVRIWDTASGVEILRMKMPIRDNFSNTYYTVVFSRDGQKLATGSLYGTQLWDIGEGKLERELDTGNNKRTDALAFHPDGKTIIGGVLGGEIRAWDLVNGNVLKKFEFLSEKVNELAYASTTSQLASDAGATFLWNFKTGAVNVISGTANSFSFSGDGKLLARGTYSGIDLIDAAAAKKIETEAAKKLSEFRGKSTGAAAISADGKTIALVDDAFAASPATLYSAGTGLKIRVIEGHAQTTSDLIFSPNGKFLASAGGATIKIADVATGKTVRTINAVKESYSSVRGVSFDSTGEILASGGLDETISLWKVTDGIAIRQIKTVENVNAIAFSPNGKLVAAALDDGGVGVWNVADGAQIQMIAAHAGDVEAIVFHPNGKFLMSGGADGRLKIWNASTGELILELFALGKKEWAVVAPDNRFDASSGALPFLHWVEGMKTVPLDAHAAQFRTAGLLQKTLGQ